MAEVVKQWDAFETAAVPLRGARPKNVKRGRAVSSGELLAVHPSPAIGDVHASVSGFVERVTETEIIISRDDKAVGQPPLPRDLSGLRADQLAVALKSLGCGSPPKPVDGPVIINTLDPEPGLTCGPALFNEQRETILAGVEALKLLWPGRPVIWAVEAPPKALADTEFEIVKSASPDSLPELVKRRITGWLDPAAEGVLGGRELYFLGRVLRTGLPLTRSVITLGQANYFIPIGARIIDLLTFANLTPENGEAVILGGLVRGLTTARLFRGLDTSVAAIHLLRAAARPDAEPCRGCGACSEACPMGLSVAEAAGFEPDQWLSMDLSLLSGCLECGACALACPSKRPLLTLARLTGRPDSAALKQQDIKP